MAIENCTKEAIKYCTERAIKKKLNHAKLIHTEVLSREGWRFYGECLSRHKILPDLDNTKAAVQSWSGGFAKRFYSQSP
jgi:hypothetical protein